MKYKGKHRRGKPINVHPTWENLTKSYNLKTNITWEQLQASKNKQNLVCEIKGNNYYPTSTPKRDQDILLFIDFKNYTYQKYKNINGKWYSMKLNGYYCQMPPAEKTKGYTYIAKDINKKYYSDGTTWKEI